MPAAKTSPPSASLGLTMKLPPGTSVRLETLRDEQLKRQHQKSQASAGEQSPLLQPPRLAPQRKANSAWNPKSASREDTSRLHIPINTSVESSDVLGTFFEEEQTNIFMGDDECREAGNHGIGSGIIRNMLDWTLGDENMLSHLRMDGTDDLSGHSPAMEENHGDCQSHEGETGSNNSYGTISDKSDMEDDDESIYREYAPIDEESLSLSPPPTMPLVLVDLEALCGCRPADTHEREVLVSQLTEALLGCPQKGHQQAEESVNAVETDCCQDTSLCPHTLTGDGLSLDFDARLVELFESGVAMHVDSSSSMATCHSLRDRNHGNNIELAEDTTNGATENGQISPTAIVPYPEFLTSHFTISSTNTTQIRSTSRLWKLLHTHHPLPVITRLFSYLRDTSRSLLWKADMHNEIRRLAYQEYKAQAYRLQRIEYNKWQNGVRREKLEKLYDVRETFLLRVNLAKDRYQSFVRERERRVEREVRRRCGDLLKPEVASITNESENDVFFDMFRTDEEENRNDSNEWDDDNKDDFLDEDMHFKESMQTPLYNRRDYSNEDLSPVGMNIVINELQCSTVEGSNEANSDIPNSADNEKTVMNANNAIKELQLITIEDNVQRKNRKLQRNIPAQNTTDYLKIEQRVQEMLKTNDERIAEAILRNLEERLDNVENLLESLQEEEWAIEEDAELELKENKSVEEEESRNQCDMTLLDQILAMILGALPNKFSGAKRQEEHFRFIKEQHSSIIQEWRETFGCLPQSFSSSNN